MKNAGHAINIEKPKEMVKHIKSFLIHPLPSPTKQVNHSSNGSNGRKVD
jgi:hypothetical protein